VVVLIVPVMVAGWDIIMRTEAPESKLGHGRQNSVLYSNLHSKFERYYLYGNPFLGG